MGRFIFNADDFGLSQGVNEGILECYQNGVLNSTTLMTTMPYFADAVKKIKHYQLPNIGLHFNLTEGSPASSALTTIVDDHGQFYRSVADQPHVDLKEVYQELKAQLDIAKKAGIDINHIDSHHHIHTVARLRPVFLQLSKEYRLPIRKIHNTLINPFKILYFYKATFGTQYYSRYFSSDFYGDHVTIDTMIRLLDQYQNKHVEIMCHPGYKDDQNGTYNEQRNIELNILTNDAIKEMVFNQSK